jgi:hypothetical protein
LMAYFDKNPVQPGAVPAAPTIATVSGGWRRTAPGNSITCTTPLTVLPLTQDFAPSFIAGSWSTLGGGCLLMSMPSWSTHQAVEVGMTALVTTDEASNPQFLAEADVFLGNGRPCVNETTADDEIASLQ